MNGVFSAVNGDCTGMHLALSVHFPPPPKEAVNEKPDGPNETIGLEFFKPRRHRPYANTGDLGPWRMDTSPSKQSPLCKHKALLVVSR